MEMCVEIPVSTMRDDAKLDALAASGVTAVTVPFAFIESSSKQELRERAAALSSRGMRLDTAHPNYGQYNTAYSLVNQYREQRGRYVEELKDSLERMGLMGARVAPLHTGGCCLPGAPAWSRELCAESVRALVPAAEDSGVTIALENTFFSVPNQWHGAGTDAQPAQSAAYGYDDLDALCTLIDACDSPLVRGCFDVGHAHFLGDLVGDHQKMGARIALYHLHDNSRVADSHMPPGYGTLDWEAIGPLVLANEQAHPAFIESKPWAKGSFALLIRSTNTLLAGGRGGQGRRCLTCGHMILTDEKGKFCGCGA